MSFLEHLEELRWHLVRSVLAILVGMVACLVFIQEITEIVILGPTRPDFPTNRLLCEINPDICVGSVTVSLQSIAPTEQFTRALLTGIVAGLIVAFPYIAWEMWRFVKPGLKTRELKRMRGVVLVVSALFLLGVAFSYFILFPFTYSFLATFQITPDIENNWRIGSVIALLVQLVLAGGILFEMPVLAWVLTRIGLLGPRFMRKYRKHAVVGIIVAAGILTPSPDFLSQLIMAIPMYALYEVSIFNSARTERNQEAKEKADANPPPVEEAVAEVVEP
jgi:sec-independent protein translocase protein TatC